MARNHGAILFSLWDDPDFLKLTPHERLMWFVYIGEPALNYAGYVVLRRGLWAENAGLTYDEALAAERGLEAARFIVVDEHTSELLVRSYVRRDGVADSPNLLKSAISCGRNMRSPKLRRAFAAELRRLPPKPDDKMGRNGRPIVYPDPHAAADMIDPDGPGGIFASLDQANFRNPSAKGSANPSGIPSGKGLPKGSPTPTGTAPVSPPATLPGHPNGAAIGTLPGTLAGTFPEPQGEGEGVGEGVSSWVGGLDDDERNDQHARSGVVGGSPTSPAPTTSSSSSSSSSSALRTEQPTGPPSGWNPANPGRCPRHIHVPAVEWLDTPCRHCGALSAYAKSLAARGHPTADDATIQERQRRSAARARSMACPDCRGDNVVLVDPRDPHSDTKPCDHPNVADPSPT
jgi:hypothetical protein